MGNLIQFSSVKDKKAGEFRSLVKVNKGTKIFNTSYTIEYKDLIAMHNYYKMVVGNKEILDRVNGCLIDNISKGAVFPEVPKDLSYLFIKDVNKNLSLVHKALKDAREIRDSTVC